MKVRLPTLAIFLILVVNVYVLAGSFWNRYGEPEALLELTERELALPYSHGFERENSGIALRIQRPNQGYDWLDADKLRTLGVEPDALALDRHHARAREVRRIHAVLEFDGPAFEALLRARREEVDSMLRSEETSEARRKQLAGSVAEMAQRESRLVVIDAGLDPEALRDRYPDRRRYAVVEASLNIYAAFPAGESEPEARSTIGQLQPQRVYVPHRFHAALEAAVGSERRLHGGPPRYRVDLRWGRRLEPWVAGITPLTGD